MIEQPAANSADKATQIALATVRVQEAKKIKARLEKALQESLQETFNESTKLFFEWYPHLETISWTQYSPWFNDGEECTFSRNEIDVNGHEVNGLDSLIDYHAKSPEERMRYAAGHPWVVRDYERAMDNMLERVLITEGVNFSDLADFINAFDDEFYEEAFGNHVEVTIRKDGVTVEEYEHD